MQTRGYDKESTVSKGTQPIITMNSGFIFLSIEDPVDGRHWPWSGSVAFEQCFTSWHQYWRQLCDTNFQWFHCKTAEKERIRDNLNRLSTKRGKAEGREYSRKHGRCIDKYGHWKRRRKGTKSSSADGSCTLMHFNV